MTFGTRSTNWLVHGNKWREVKCTKGRCWIDSTLLKSHLSHCVTLEHRTQLGKCLIFAGLKSILLFESCHFYVTADGKPLISRSAKRAECFPVRAGGMSPRKALRKFHTETTKQIDRKSNLSEEPETPVCITNLLLPFERFSTTVSFLKRQHI